MNNAIIPQAKRSRGRPRKNLARPVTINKNETFTPQIQYSTKRKLTEAASDEIEIIEYNGLDLKKPKIDEDGADIPAVRSQPPRRARFTESYGGEGGDVVVISDEEQNRDEEDESESDSEDERPIPSPILKVRSKDEQEKWQAKVEQQKKELKDEEMKLVLLWKLRDSQKTKDAKRELTGSPLLHAVKHMPQNSAPINLKGGMQIQPLPSKRLLSNAKYTSPKKSISIQPLPNVVPKPSSSTSFKPIQPVNKPTKPLSNVHKPYESSNNSTVVSSTSVEQLNSNHLHQYPLLKNLSNQITITPVPPVSSSPPVVPAKQDKKADLETLQQQQAAAKLALRKELEKTLLQIPLPKPPPMKMNFYPNPNSIEFLCLLGLDHIVDFMTKSKKPSPRSPLACAQCTTDFTCAWKWKEVERNGKKAYDVFCEACITSNIRKSLKAQHTNNLKTAFLKALQQEKEIDRLTVPVKKPHTSSSTSTSRTEARQSPRLPTPSPAHQANNTSAFSSPRPGPTLPYIPKATQQAFNQLNHHNALAQLSKFSPQYQSILQAQAQQFLATGIHFHPGMLPFSPFMTPSPNHSRGKSSSSRHGDSRRQHYRPDKGQSPSLPPQAPSSWKA